MMNGLFVSFDEAVFQGDSNLADWLLKKRRAVRGVLEANLAGPGIALGGDLRA